MKRLICATAVALTLVTAANSQTDPVAPLSVRVHDLTITSHTINVLATLAQKYHVVIGLYGTFIGDDSHDIAISLKDGTLDEVFDAIVRADPRLEWKQANNGAIHFIFLDTPLSLFDITVHSFDVEDPRRMQIADSLAQIPEIAGWLRDHRCDMYELIQGHFPNEWGKFAVHARDTPFSAVLDGIAARSGTYFWRAIQYSGVQCAINLGFPKDATPAQQQR
jgi:hypothetical protein